jgi:hypothetical protein
MRRIGAYTRHIGIGDIDGRRREARLMREVTAELTRHVGGKPSAVQKMLIDRIARLQLRLMVLDSQVEPGGDMTERNTRQYLAWSNTLERSLRRLGLQAVPERGQTLADVIAGHADRMATTSSQAAA